MVLGENTIRLGAGAGFAGDRIDPAVELVHYGGLDYLIFECLGERTVADGQLRRRSNPSKGYDPLLVKRIDAVLDDALKAKTTIITNGGSANVPAALEEIIRVVKKHTVARTVRIAAILGDDVTNRILNADPSVWETGNAVSAYPAELLSGNAYLGADSIVPALEQDVDIVITGRVADPSLYLAPMMFEYGWGIDEWDLLGKGTCVGHLLECAGQLTGGYFADPGVKDVPGLARLGFPFADVAADGSAVLGKLEQSGGLLDIRTCREQLLYEVTDPRCYLTPDVSADFSRVEFETLRPNRVKLNGATGMSRPDTLKVSLGFRGGWMAEGQITYAGLRAEARAKLAAEIVTERMHWLHDTPKDSLVVEYIGTGSAFRGAPGSTSDYRSSSNEVRLRVSGVFANFEIAETLPQEVESLYTNGPAGGGGARGSVREVVAIRSASLDRKLVTPVVHIEEVHP